MKHIKQSAFAYVQSVSASFSQSVLILTNMRPYSACLDAFVHLRWSKQVEYILMKTTSSQPLGLKFLFIHFWQMQMQHSYTYAGPAAASCHLHDTFYES